MRFEPTIARRRLLQVGSLGLGACSLPAMLAASEAKPAPRAKSCILLYMDGGPSHIDLFDLKPQAAAEIRGPFQSIATSVVGTRVCEHLPRLAQQMQRVLQVRSMRHQQLVHDPAVYQMLTGYKHVSSAGGLEVQSDDLPHMACSFSAADRQAAVMPKAILVPDTMRMQGRVLPGQNAGILGPAFDPFAVTLSREGGVDKPDFTRQSDVPLARLSGRSCLLQQFNQELSQLEHTSKADRLNAFQQQALSILASSSVQTAFDVEREPDAMHARYGRHRHGQSVLLARRLIEAGTRFVTVYWGNEEQDWANGKPPTLANNPWDTHRNHFPLVKGSLTPRADQAFAALLSDLDERGLLDETLIIWMGDFGRTPRISTPWASRDHWPHAFTILLAGAGVRAGAVYGRTDRHAAYVDEAPVSPADLTATIFDALGIDAHAVVTSAGGTAHQISQGRIVREWFV